MSVFIVSIALKRRGRQRMLFTYEEERQGRKLSNIYAM